MDFDKYEEDVFRNIDRENMEKIITFLEHHNCNYIDELVNDYLDLFTFDYDDFVSKFNILNKKYNNNLIEVVRDDMNILEEFYDE